MRFTLLFMHLTALYMNVKIGSLVWIHLAYI